MKKLSPIELAIITHKTENPKASYKEIQEKFGADHCKVYRTLKKARLTRKNARRRVQVANPTKGQEILREVLKREPAAIKQDAGPTQSIHALNVEIYSLRQQIAGYISVISYLEHKLGMKQDGAPV